MKSSAVITRIGVKLFSRRKKIHNLFNIVHKHAQRFITVRTAAVNFILPI